MVHTCRCFSLLIQHADDAENFLVIFLFLLKELILSQYNQSVYVVTTEVSCLYSSQSVYVVTNKSELLIQQSVSLGCYNKSSFCMQVPPDNMGEMMSQAIY